MTVERLDEETWHLLLDEEPILRVTAHEVSTLEELRYARMEPLVGLSSLPRSIWREAKRQFQLHATFPLYAICDNPTASRFLLFMGFKETGLYLGRKMFWRA